MSNFIKISYIRSAIGRNEKQKRIIKALGFRRMHQSRIVEDTPSIRGMVNQVVHLVQIEKVEKPEVKSIERKVKKVKEASVNA